MATAQKPRSAVLIVQDSRVLLIKRTKTSQPVYYVLPGGGIEAGETPAQAARREMMEELGVDITVESVELDHTVIDRQTWIVRSRLTGNAEPKWLEEQSPDNRYEAVWVPLGQLASILILPPSMTSYILAV